MAILRLTEGHRVKIGCVPFPGSGSRRLTDGGSRIGAQHLVGFGGAARCPYARSLRPKQLPPRPARNGDGAPTGRGRSPRGRRLTCQCSAVVFRGGLPLRWIKNFGLSSIDFVGMLADGAGCLLILFFVVGFGWFSCCLGSNVE